MGDVVISPEETAVLVLTDDARDQHVIFDALDESQFKVILSAGNLEEARENLQDMRISLLVADLEFGMQELAALCAGDDDAEPVEHAIAIVHGRGAAGRVDWDQIPTTFGDCLRSPVDPDELMFRIERLLGGAEESSQDRVEPVIEVNPNLRRLMLLGAEPSDDGPGLAGLTDRIGADLGLDYLVVIGHQEGTQLSVHSSYGEDLDLDQAARLVGRKCLRKVLGGDVVMWHGDQGALDVRDLIGGREDSCFLGLPLRTTEGAIIGALLAGSSKPPEPWDSAEALIRASAGRFADILEIRRLKTRSRVRGLQDSLTRLPNRMLFNDRLSHAVKEAERTGEQFAVMFVDLDRFKSLNDSLGQAIGDQLLVELSSRLRASVRKSDTVGRYAGDQFTLVLRHILRRDDVARIAEKLNHVLSVPVDLPDGEDRQVTASIGISFYPDDGAGAEVLLKRADMAMFRAKRQGRNSYQMYTEGEDDSEQQKLQLETKLRQAQQHDELRIFYQPQMSTETEDIVGMEALIRWEHPDLGLISPGFFVPLAEETGLIVPIGEWLLREACRQTRLWQDRFDVKLSLGVNLSPLQLCQTDLVETVESALDDSGLQARYLDLEVTESLSIKSIPGLRETLSRLRELGCSISIDDFGTGQASLDYLKQFPADRLKIDQVFVRNIGLDPDDEAIVRATIDMAHQLNMEVVAEGVEQEDHLDFLASHQCDQLQGFLFCRPVPKDAFTRLLTEREALTRGTALAGEG